MACGVRPMRSLLFLAALSFSVAASAQSNDSGTHRSDQNTQGANTEGSGYDPATKARVRTEGAAGGLQGGIKGDAQDAENATAGQGSPNTHSKHLKRGGKGRVHDETSSDREQGRGARGAIR